MVDSILTSIKQLVGIEADDTSFDFDMITHINSALATLTDLGVGPDTGFVILNDQPEWDNFLGASNIRQGSVIQYVALRVKLAFDPPDNQPAIAALQDQLKEQEWRINVRREGESWTDPLETP